MHKEKIVIFFYWEPELIIQEHWIQRKKCIHWLVNNFIWHSVLVITWLVKSRDNVWLTIMWYLLLWANEHVLVLHVVGNYEYKLCPFHIAEKPFSANQKYSYSYRENFSSNHFMHRFQKIFFPPWTKNIKRVMGAWDNSFIVCVSKLKGLWFEKENISLEWKSLFRRLLS